MEREFFPFFFESGARPRRWKKRRHKTELAPLSLTHSYPPPTPSTPTQHSPDTYYGEEVSVLEMDGAFDKLEELIYVESHLSQTSSKFYGEITQQMLKNSAFPGSTNGTGLFQTICGLKIREVYEKIVKKEVAAVSA
jgi:hypothetical protein